MTHTSRVSFALAIVAGCFAAVTISLFANSASQQEELEALLVRYDREADGPVKDRLAARIDSVAHQKYATVSRLYWHTDLASAKAAARELGRPILHLRMLGRLDEDLSCANSRLFRATLYANQDVSRFLRERFILYWSSERPVPRVTIDYGDGRKLERTTTGNSAHYILDEDGQVLDVLPGLYAPAAFRRELQGSLELADRVRGQTDHERAKQLVGYHELEVIAAQKDWERLAGTAWIPRMGRLPTQARSQSQLVAAQRAAMSKMVIERTDLRYFIPGLRPEDLAEDQIEMWSAAGQMLVDVPRVLDDTSRALIVRLHNQVPAGMRATGEKINAMIARLEQSVVADSALNHLRLRPQIGNEIVQRGGRIDFATLNAWIYTEVFRTPKQDAWLGLLPRDVFTGLPGDGVVIRK